MPAYTNWPILKQIFSFMLFVLNLIFEGLERVGVINVALTVILFSLFIQLLLLPLQIYRGSKRRRRGERDQKISALKSEYKEDYSNPEYIEKKKKIMSEYTEAKAPGCLLTIVQVFIILLSFSSLGSMNETVTVLAGLNEAELANAYTTLGINFALSTKEDLWPNILLVVLYLLLHFLPGFIRRLLAKRKAFKIATEGMNEKEREQYREEHRFSIHKDGFEVFQLVTSAAFPCLIASASLMLPGYFLWYWILGSFWRPVLFKGAKKIRDACRKKFNPVKIKV